MALGPLILDLDGERLSADEKDLLGHPVVGGVILFARNYAEPEQLAALCAEIHALRQPRLLIGVDHEGGRVQRFRAGFTELPVARALGEIYANNAREAVHLAGQCGWLMAAELRACGVDFSFAPVLDLYDERSRVINDRAFDPEPVVVAQLAQAYSRGMRGAGMAAVGKHFPGHGLVSADSHCELPRDERDYADIETHDLVPFRVMIDAGIEALMPAHILYPKVDELPVGYSSVWLGEILRSGCGFQGAIFSDDLSMVGATLSDTAPLARAERALAAGCDACLVCNDRAAATAIVDGLSLTATPLRQVRLMRLHGRGAGGARHELQSDERWRAAHAAVAQLTATPRLALGDDTPA